MKILEQILQEIEKERGDESDYKRPEDKKLVRHWNNCIDVIAEIIRSYMEDDGWIPVEERLPTREEYLKDDGRFMLDDGNRRYQGLFNIYDGKFMFSKHISGLNYEFFVDKCVIAWQPLLALYQPKED